MARYSLSYKTVTPVAVADTTNYTSNGYGFLLQGGSSTQQLKINEVYIGGEATASTVNTMILARDSTVGATVTAGGTFVALMDGTATAPATTAVTGNASTTQPQRSATLHLLGLSLNTFGGIARWQARYGEEITTVGNTASLGEVSLSSAAGTGIISGHCIYEVA